MAGIFDEKCREKEKYREEQIGELVVVNLYTKFEVSILKRCKDIFDEKSGEKEKRTNTRHRKRYNPLALYPSSYSSHC